MVEEEIIESPVHDDSGKEPSSDAAHSRLQRWLLVLILLAWVIRLPILFIPVSPLGDEELLLEANRISNASRFVEAPSWGERWEIQQQYSWGGRVLWVVVHMVWGYLVPSEGAAALIVPLVAAIIAAAALALAAGRLYGPAARLPILLLISLSPLFLNYSASLRGTMQSFMWLSLALASFTGSATSLWRWALGGLFLGLSFVTHYGSGTAIVALALGLAFGMIRRTFRSAVDPSRLRELIAALLGVISSLLPPALLHLWSRAAGSDYVYRLLTHENLAFEALGPRGLWLRKLFELDPLLQALTLVLIIVWIRRAASLRAMILPALVTVTLAATFVIALGQRPLEAHPSILIATVAAIALSLCFPEASTVAITTPAALPAQRDEMALDHTAVIVSVVAAFALLTASRQLSAMPRLVFPCLALFVLAIIGSMRRAPELRMELITKFIAVIGTIAFLIGLAGIYSARSAGVRAERFARQHSEMARLHYENFYMPQERTVNCARMALRSDHQIAIIGPLARLYPGITHEEEPYKIDLMRGCIEQFDLGGVLTAEQMPFATLFYRPSNGVASDR
ncbi:MAG TPA: hypothetical protein VMT00_06900 [Thermoanaerobaculia bacterium]|nr:hypothetical protein [Thermoanaerobaculia bacterium]